MNFKNLFNSAIEHLYYGSKNLDKKDIKQYRVEIDNLYKDLEMLSDLNLVNKMIEQEGIEETFKKYKEYNTRFKEYYPKIIKTLVNSWDTPKELRLKAKRAEILWPREYSKVLLTLAKAKSKQDKDGIFEDVKVYHSNAYDREEGETLPWLRKEDINEEDRFNEGLKGLVGGAIGGATLACVIHSLSTSFRFPVKTIYGVSVALGMWIGQFAQKHFFIDFTNYNKVKRYVTDFPESYEYIMDLMQRNASKFYQKDPWKYKKIMDNMKRIAKNPPRGLEPHWLDEPDEEDIENDPFSPQNVARREAARQSFTDADYYSMKDLRGLDKQSPSDVADELEDLFKGY